MTKPNEKLVEFPRQSARDILTDVLRDGAQQMLATAIEAEVDDYLAGLASTVDAAGRRYVVRNGHLPPRAIQTPLGDVQVQQPRVRDRRPTDERETFRSAILPPYLRKTPSLEALYPWLYLKVWVANYYSARNPLRLSSLVILGVVARMFRCATRSSCWCT